MDNWNYSWLFFYAVLFILLAVLTQNDFIQLPVGTRNILDIFAIMYADIKSINTICHIGIFKRENRYLSVKYEIRYISNEQREISLNINFIGLLLMSAL